MLTEEQARTRWCPFTRVTGDGEEWHTNRPSHAEVHQKQFDHCIASQCMAWRWGEAERNGAPVLDEDAPARVRFEPSPDRKGRCGLAGTAPHG